MNKSTFFIFAFILILATAVLNGCVKTETTPGEPAEPEEGELELISDISCDGNAITITLTNTGDSIWNIAEDITFYVNNYKDESPGCDKNILEPGESTTCTSLDAASLGLSPSIMVVSLAGKAVQKVSCE